MSVNQCALVLNIVPPVFCALLMQQDQLQTTFMTS